jgi:hypothetical protein
MTVIAGSLHVIGEPAGWDCLTAVCADHPGVRCLGAGREVLLFS